MGQKQTSQHLQPMSALPPKADIRTQPRNVQKQTFTERLLETQSVKRASLGRIPIVGPNTLQKKKAAVVVPVIDDQMRCSGHDLMALSDRELSCQDGFAC
jgi:hypothetical protein